MTLTFRNVDADPDGPVEDWPTEAVLTALERGGLSHWRRLASAVQDDPWGAVARRVEAALAAVRPYGVADLMEEILSRARTRAEQDERDEVAAEVADLAAASGLTRAGFASAIGTSAPRLSTYVTGRVTPSAALMVRMRRVAENARRGAGASER